MKRYLLLPASLLALFVTTARVEAQSIWNAGTGNWFTPGNWTPSGVPDTNIKAQINNGGTAQITTAGAAANTVNLGNGFGETGTLSVSGTGTLTINGSTGFYLIVGEGGTGTMNVTGGGSVAPPVLFIGDLANSVGTATVSGAGSIINAQFEIEVGRSGQGTLNVLDGGTVSTSVVNVGNGTGSGHIFVTDSTGVVTTFTASGVNIGGNALGSTGDVAVSGAKAKFTGGGVDVGSAGSGTLTVSTGATGKSTSLLIGDAGMGTVTITGTGTTFNVSTGSATGTVTVGGSAVGNLNVEGGAVLTSDLGVIGKHPGGIGTATVTGAGSSWSLNSSFTLIIGQSSAAGGSGTLNILNGGKFSAANLDAYTDTTIKVDGTGSQLLLPNDFPLNKSLFLGSVGVNKLDVTNGGTLATGSALLNTTATSSLAINLAGTGSSWTQSQFVGALTTQFGGAGTATFKVSDHAAFSFSTDADFNMDATGTGTASLTVSSGGSFSVGTTSGTLRIGQDGTGSLTIDSGGTVTAANTYIGENTGAVGTATLSGVGSTWNVGGLNVGALGGHGTVDVFGGAKLIGSGFVGPAGTLGGSGSVTLSGAGTSWVASIAPSGPGNSITVSADSSLTVQSGASLSSAFLVVGGNGVITIQGAETQVQSTFDIASSGTSLLKVLDGAVVHGVFTVLSGGSGAGTVATVDGATTQWLTTAETEVGTGAKATLNVLNGAKFSGTNIYFGYDNGGNGLGNVMGTGSSLVATGYLRVADWTNNFGTLTISQGGTVTSVSGASASNFSGIGSTNTSNGSIVVTGANSSWTNTGAVYVGKSGTTGVGTLTVTDSGTVTITGAASINAGSTLNIGTGALPGTFSASSLASEGLIHFNHTGSYTYSVPTSGGGAVTKDGSGTTIITGTHTYTGATTVNAGLLQVDGVLGTTAVSVASGATLGGKGTLGGVVTIQNGGHLAPGDSPGTMTVASLILNPTSNLDFQLDTPGVVGSNVNDLIEVTGSLTLDGTLNITGLSHFAAGVYRLIDYGGTFTNNVLALGTAPGSHTYDINVSTPGQVNLLVDQAALFFWDGPNTVANNVVDGGTGTWNNNVAQTNWTNVLGNPNSVWGAGQVAIFSGTAGDVTLGDNISYSGMQFKTTNYAILPDAGGLYSLSPVGAATITVDTGLRAYIYAPITGGGGLTVDGLGTLVLGGANTYTGGTFIDGGNLQLGDATHMTSIVGAVDNRTILAVSNADLSAVTTLTNHAGSGTTFFNSSSAASMAITNQGSAISIILGGATTFVDTSSAGSATFVNEGAGVSGAGRSGRVYFSTGTTAGNAVFTNEAGTVSDAAGGLVAFEPGSNPGNATLTNNGASVSGASGGLTSFNTSVGGTPHLTNNGGTVNGAHGGMTVFLVGTSGSAVVINEAGAVSGAEGGATVFQLAGGLPLSTATITNHGAALSGAGSGLTILESNSVGMQLNITNNGSSVTGGLGGLTQITDNSGTGTGTVNNLGGTLSGAGGGLTQFMDMSDADHAGFTNNAGAVAGALGGTVEFRDTSTANSATITNKGVSTGSGREGDTQFYNTAAAGSATLNNQAGTAVGTISVQGVSLDGGFTGFNNNSSAGTARIHNFGSATNGVNGGMTLFVASSTLGSAVITNDGGSVSGAGGGFTIFQDTTSAGVSPARIINDGGSNGGSGGTTYFFNSAGAGSATIENTADDGHGGLGGFTYFLNSSNAGTATINNRGGSVANASAGHSNFTDTASAMNATINNYAGSNGGGQGNTSFLGSSTAANATINNLGGLTAFFPGSTAENANINNTLGGTTVFRSTAANATITSGADSGTYFYTFNQTTGSARFIFTSPSSFLDISGAFPTVTVGSIEGDGAVFLGSKELIVGANNRSTTFSGVIQDGGQYAGTGGSLTKIGIGTLTLAGINTYTGNTNINGGTLFVDGSLASANVTVNAGGTLGGNGTIFGNVINAGVVSPGHSPGMLHIGGNYTQTSGGTLVIEVASATSFDKLAIDGHASLAGTLRVVQLNGYQPKLGDRLVFLTAGGGVSGKFTSTNNDFLGTLVRLDVVYEPDDVVLVGAQNSFTNAFGITTKKAKKGSPTPQPASILGITPNQIAVALTLDSALVDPRQAKVLAFLDGLDFNTVPHQLDKIAPEELTSIFTLGFAQLDAEVLSLQQRLADIRIGVREAEEVRRAEPLGKEPVNTGLPEEDHYGFFLTETGDFASAGDTYNSNGFNIKSAGTTLGVDVRLSHHFILGLMLEYERTDSDLIDGGHLRVDGGKAALYGMYHNGGFFTEGLVGGGYNSYDTSRSALNGIAHGRTDGGQLDSYLGVGFDKPVGPVVITPIASLLYSVVGIQGFDEFGSLQPLHIDSQNESSMRGRMGMRVAHTDHFHAATLTSSFSAQWQHEFLDDDLALDSRFGNGAGTPFTVRGPRIGRDSALLTAAFNVQWSTYAAYVAYQADLGRKNYENQTVLVGLRVSW